MFLLFFVLLAALSLIYYTFKLGISPMPSHRQVKKCLPRILPECSMIYELGSGWGGMARFMAKARPNSRVVGFEKSLIPWAFSLLKTRQNLYFHRRDFFDEKLDRVDCIYVYLFPKAMERLKAKLENEAKEGTIVISYVFAIPGWKPTEVFTLNDLYKSKLYIYQTMGTI